MCVCVCVYLCHAVIYSSLFLPIESSTKLYTHDTPVLYPFMCLRTVSYRALPGWPIKPNSMCATKRRSYLYPETSQRRLKGNTRRRLMSIFNSYATIYCPNIRGLNYLRVATKKRKSLVPRKFKCIQYTSS